MESFRDFSIVNPFRRQLDTLGRIKKRKSSTENILTLQMCQATI